MIKSVAVYLGSASASEKYLENARTFGRKLAENGYKAVYGGAEVGTMRAFADGVLEAGGEIVGVFPKGFPGKREVAAEHRSIASTRLTEMVFVADLAERINVMNSLSDCCVILPGSYGTLEELSFFAVDNEIGLHDKTAYILNVNGYYDGLEELIANMKREHFLRADSKVVQFVHSIDELFNELKK